MDLTILLASILAAAAPVVLAAVGETITEKSGVINLSLDGTILLSAMAAFAVAYETQSVPLGFVAAGAAGGLVAALIGFFSLFLNQSQVAVGFVLTLTLKDLAYFLGNPYSRMYGPQVSHLPIPVLSDIPFLGPVLFSHNLPVYLSVLIIGLIWWYLYRTRMGLSLRAVGENPEAAYARGVNSRAIQMGYTVLGGFLVGLAGATFSLCTKPGWGRPQGAEGTGWIALAIVIFGGWHPVKAALGAYLFALLQVMGIHFQSWWPSVPAQVFQVAPFPLMIFTLVLMHLAQKGPEGVAPIKRDWLHRLSAFLGGSAPGALGKTFRSD
jgi:simple sugar transport system permease protein